MYTGVKLYIVHQFNVRLNQSREKKKMKKNRHLPYVIFLSGSGFYKLSQLAESLSCQGRNVQIYDVTFAHHTVPEWDGRVPTSLWTLPWTGRRVVSRSVSATSSLSCVSREALWYRLR